MKNIGLTLFLAALLLSICLNGVLAEDGWDRTRPLDAYSEFGNAFEDYFIVEKNGKRGVINPDGQLLCEVKWQEIEAVTPWLFCVADDQIGYTYDLNGNEIVPGVIGTILYETFCRTYNAEGAEGVVTAKGDVLIELTNETPEFKVSEKHDMWVVNANGKWGLLNLEGDVVISPRYKSLRILAEDRLTMQDESGLWGLIDPAGNVILAPRYDRILGQTEGLIVFCHDQGYGFMDMNGNVVIPNTLVRADNFHEGLAAFGADPVTVLGLSGRFSPILYGYIDRSGTVVIPPQWQETYGFCNGYAVVGNGEKFGYIDRNGKLICDMIWDEAEGFSDGRAKVYKDGKSGFIDTTGKLIEPLR